MIRKENIPKHILALYGLTVWGFVLVKAFFKFQMLFFISVSSLFFIIFVYSFFEKFVTIFSCSKQNYSENINFAKQQVLRSNDTRWQLLWKKCAVLEKNYFPESIFIIKQAWVIKKCKLKWFGHVSRPAGLAKTILQGTVHGGRRRGWQKKGWESHIFDWKGLKFCCDTLTESEDKIQWRDRVARFRVPQQSPWLQDRCRCRCKIPCSPLWYQY